MGASKNPNVKRTDKATAASRRPKSWPTIAELEIRRANVLSLHLRKFSLRDIAKIIAGKDEAGNPKKPLSVPVIAEDLSIAKKTALSEILRPVEEWHLEVAEVRKQYWKSQDMEGVLNCLREEAKARGWYAPEKHEHSGKDGQPIFITLEGGDANVEPPGKD